MLQTICVTGNGEIFSSCSSTMARASAKSLAGRCITRRKTFPAATRRCSTGVAKWNASFFRLNYQAGPSRQEWSLWRSRVKLSFAGVELPDASGFIADLQHVTGMPASHGRKAGCRSVGSVGVLGSKFRFYSSPLLHCASTPNSPMLR